jgi:hypothetical protein
MSRAALVVLGVAVLAGSAAGQERPALAPTAGAVAPQSQAASATPGATSLAVPTAGPSPVGKSFRVKYRSASNVYLEGGSAQGLAPGDRLRATDGKAVTAELEVSYVAEHSASCKPVSETRPVREGDALVVQPRPQGAKSSSPAVSPKLASPVETSAPVAPPAPAATPSPSASPETPAKRPWARLRASASIGYYRAWDNTESNYDFDERTARLELGLYDLGGQPLSFVLRGRSRQDVRARALSSRTPKDERQDRLYEVALRYEPPSDSVTIELGRVGVQRFVGVGYLDGGIFRVRVLGGLQLGAFAGRVADVEGLGFNGTGRKLGGFLRFGPRGRYASSGFESTLAFVREDAAGDVSRECFSLETRVGNGSRFSFFERAELDLNSGWRRELTGKSAQLTNVSLSGNLRLAATLSAFASYDGRRNYRYYRNRVVPEEVFDDLLHQGLRAGFNWYRPHGLGASVGFGTSLKEKDPRHPELNLANAYSFNAGLRHDDVFSSGLSIGLDGSGFWNGYTDGGLASLRIGRRFGAGHSLDLSYGQSLYRVTQTRENRKTQWLRLVGRASLGRRLYVLSDLEYDAGDDLEGPRALVELGAVF